MGENSQFINFRFKDTKDQTIDCGENCYDCVKKLKRNKCVFATPDKRKKRSPLHPRKGN
jgi:hypothetical protein